MDLYLILKITVFLLILISVIVTFWTYLTYKKEQMQANLFLRYEYVRKSSLAFFLAIALYIIVNSLDNLGINLPIIYLIIINLVVLILVLISLYYFNFKVRNVSKEY
jgi:hypothetical protein